MSAAGDVADEKCPVIDVVDSVMMRRSGEERGAGQCVAVRRSIAANLAVCDSGQYW